MTLKSKIHKPSGGEVVLTLFSLSLPLRSFILSFLSFSSGLLFLSAEVFGDLEVFFLKIIVVCLNESKHYFVLNQKQKG